MTNSGTRPLTDHLAITRPINISDKGVIPCGISDRDAIFLVRSMRIPRIKKHPKIRKARKFKNFENHLFLKDLEALHLDEIKNNTKDPNQMWSLWRNLFLGVLDKHALITEIKIRGNNLPYVTSEMRQLIKTRDHLKKKPIRLDPSTFSRLTNRSEAKCPMEFESYDQSIIPKRLRKVLVI